MTLTPATREMLSLAMALYDGDMLDVAMECGSADAPIATARSKHIYNCSAAWVRHNLGLNDIYVLSLAMHEVAGLKAGWLGQDHQGCGEPGGEYYSRTPLVLP